MITFETFNKQEVITLVSKGWNTFVLAFSNIVNTCLKLVLFKNNYINLFKISSGISNHREQTLMGLVDTITE